MESSGVWDPAPTVADQGVHDSAVEAVLRATRSLLWIETAADVASIMLELVNALGGAVVAARTAGEDALPVDISFGEGEPTLPTAAVGASRGCCWSGTSLARSATRTAPSSLPSACPDWRKTRLLTR